MATALQHLSKSTLLAQENGLEHVVIDIDLSTLTASACGCFRSVRRTASSIQHQRIELPGSGAAVVKAMNDDEALDALAADGRLIKSHLW